MAGILKFFKRDSNLPDPSGPLASVVPPSNIQAANRAVKRALEEDKVAPGGSRGQYEVFSP